MNKVKKQDLGKRDVKIPTIDLEKTIWRLKNFAMCS